MDLSRTYILYSLSAYLVTFLTIRLARIGKVPRAPLPFRFIQGTLSVAGPLVIVSILAAGGLRYFNLNILDVYEFRRDASSNLPLIFAYLSPWTGCVLLPASFVLAITKKQRTHAAAIALCVVALFGFTAIKSILVYPILAFIDDECQYRVN